MNEVTVQYGNSQEEKEMKLMMDEPVGEIKTRLMSLVPDQYVVHKVSHNDE